MVNAEDTHSLCSRKRQQQTLAQQWAWKIGWVPRLTLSRHEALLSQRTHRVQCPPLWLPVWRRRRGAVRAATQANTRLDFRMLELPRLLCALDFEPVVRLALLVEALFPVFAVILVSTGHPSPGHPAAGTRWVRSNAQANG